MRLLHVSDTHIGFSAYSKLNAAGLNQREQDFFDAFERAITLALEERVDVVLHSGDVFDSVRPTNRAVTFAMSQIARLGRIPFVAIAGNHETPKLRETGSVLRFLDFVPNARAIYKGVRETVRVGDLAIHGVPHAASEDALKAELDAVERDAAARWNVLSFHAGVVGVGDFRTGEFNEHVVPTSYVRRDMDYVALGHYHAPTELAPNARYAGSTERTSFKEAGEPKGGWLVDLEAGRIEFRDLRPRPMLTLPDVDCRGMAEIEVPTAIYKAIESADLDGRIARLRVKDVPPHVYATLDFQRVRRLTERALHFQAAWEVARADAPAPDGGGHSFTGLRGEFEGWYDRVPVEGVDRERLKARALALIAEAESR